MKFHLPKIHLRQELPSHLRHLNLILSALRFLSLLKFEVSLLPLFFFLLIYYRLFLFLVSSNIVRVRAPGQNQQIRVLGNAGSPQIVRNPLNSPVTSGNSSMSGIAALAAAAAATQKLNTTTTSAGSIKVLPSSIVGPGGTVKVGNAGQTVRLISPTGQVLLT